MNYEESPRRRLAMSLRQIEVFRAIMITGSISEAARMLFIAQPSVSRVLAVTEERLGFPLFERARGRLFPTPEARCVFEEVQSAYEGIERVDELVRALVEGRSGKLNVVCSPSLGNHLVPRTIAQFRTRYPELPIHFDSLRHSDLVPRVLFGKNYLGVSMFDTAHPNLVSEPLVQVPLVCISPKGWLDEAPTVRLHNLRGRPWIDYRDNTPLGRMVGEVLGSERGPQPAVEVLSPMSACALVREGVGMAVVDPFCVDAAMRQCVDVRPLSPEKLLKVHAVYPRVEPLSHSGREFLVMLRKVLKALPEAR
jgi:DNA-binding transcriptional LysR family regulator